jgi:hypothetical protein
MAGGEIPFKKEKELDLLALGDVGELSNTNPSLSIFSNSNTNNVFPNSMGVASSAKSNPNPSLGVIPASNKTSVFPNSIKSPGYGIEALMNSPLGSSVSQVMQSIKPASNMGSPMMQNFQTLAPPTNRTAGSGGLVPAPTNVPMTGTDLLMRLSNTNISNPNSASQYEINDYKARELQLHQKKQELNDFQSELDTLEPTSAELAKKRETLDFGKILLIRIQTNF